MTMLAGGLPGVVPPVVEKFRHEDAIGKDPPPDKQKVWVRGPLVPTE
jgi:hypothetical protein